MKANEYKKDLIKAIDKEIKSLPELDGNGVLWWNTFKKFVKDFEPQVKQEPINFEALLDLINKTFSREFRVISGAVKSKYRARLRDGYTKEDIFRAIQNCKNAEFHTNNDYRYCTPTFFSQETTLEKWGSRKVKDENVDDHSPVN
jgi:uncharacterized phage protein (TIGR02220 family)